MLNGCFLKKRLVIFFGIIVMGSCIEGCAPIPRPPRRRTVVVHPVPRHGKGFRAPVGYRTVLVGRKRYFYHGGVFYRKARRGFVVVKAPVGAVVATLPVGFVTLSIGGLPFYCYEGVYYRKVPSGYVVVDPPR